MNWEYVGLENIGGDIVCEAISWIGLLSWNIFWIIGLLIIIPGWVLLVLWYIFWGYPFCLTYWGKLLALYEKTTAGLKLLFI